MADEKKTLKFQMMMSPQEAEQLDDWMFKTRLRSRAEAIRRLCQIGLALEGSIPELETQLKGLAESVRQVTNTYDAFERDETGEIDADVVFVSITEAMRNSLLVLRTVAEVGEIASYWRVDDDIERVAADVEKLRARMALRRKSHRIEDMG